MTENINTLLFILVFGIIIVALSIYILLRIVDGYIRTFNTGIQKWLDHHFAQKTPNLTYASNKLGALEKSMLLMHRVSPDQIAVRESFENKTVKEYSNQLLWSIRHELDYNEVQSLYLSTQLEKIIKIAGQEVMTFIAAQADTLSHDAPASQLANILLTKGTNFEPCEKAKAALKLEASLLA